MAKVIQLHKAGDSEEKWMPKTYSSCVDMTTYVPSSSANKIYFPIETSDNLNNALNKIVNEVTDHTQPKLKSGSSGTVLFTINGSPNQPVHFGDTITISGGGGGSGTVTTSGTPTTNTLAKFTGSTIIGNSAITETMSGSSVSHVNVSSALCVGTTTLTSGLKLQVEGNVYASGSVTCAASSSDKRLKTDVKPFKGLDIIEIMDYVQFKWNDDAVKLNNEYFKKNTINYGVIAQDVEGVIDDLVFDMPNGYKGVRYEKLIPIMAQAIKELKSEIDELKQQLKK